MSAWIFVASASLSALGALTGQGVPTRLATVLLVIFVVLEFRRIPRPQKIAAGILMATALLLAASNGAIIETILTGLARTLPFVLIFASVGWLQSAARESPSVLEIRGGIAQLGPGRRFSALATAAHLFGASFNLAGMALLTPILDDQKTERDQRRIGCAILWGFGAATAWSPFFVGTAAVLSAYPQIGWLDIAPYGMSFGLVLLVWAVVFDRLFRRGKVPPRPSEVPPLGRAIGRVTIAVLVLFAMTLLLIDGVGLPLTLAIAIAAPSYALGWLYLVHGRDNPARIGCLASGVIANYPRMRSETTLFVCANIFGFAIAQTFADLNAGGSWMPPHTGITFVNTLLAIWFYMLVSAIGIHPIVSLVVFTTAFSPEMLGISTPLLAATLMVLWGMGTSVSPLSGTTLFMAQMSGQSSFRIAWNWDGPFYLFGSIGMAFIVSVLI